MKQVDRGKQRIIGFDIDGVLTDEFVDGENIWQREVEAHFGGLELLEQSFSFTTAYGLSLIEVRKFMGAKAPRIFSEVPPKAGAKAFMEWLVARGFIIHLITARQEYYRGVTTNWLKAHDLPYRGLWFQENKGVLCHSLGIELFVDDYWENCVDIRDYGIVSLLMSADHNLFYRPEQGIYRVSNWQEVEAFTTDYYDLADDRAGASGT